MTEVVHMHHDETLDVVSWLTPDPGKVEALEAELSELIETGIACRVIATREGVCPCEATVIRLNRATRRRLWPGRRPEFESYVRHRGGCPAMAEPVRRWLYEHRRAVA